MDSKLASGDGSVSAFDANWRGRREAAYNHWTARRPQNQIQLAFRSHWQLFRELLAGAPPGRSLEVGCGRGSISSYFAQHGHDCVLLDYSQAVLQIAQEIFERNGHGGRYVCGDANRLPFADDIFDSVVSIGLLEHFEDIRTPVLEQIRVLKPGGRFFGYVVPERPDNIQRFFGWLNAVLGGVSRLANRAAKTEVVQKAEVYRSDLGSPRYLEVIADQPVLDVETSGLYPLPMISHSPEFPFSLLPRPLELTLTRIFETVLWCRRKAYRRNPWMCSEALGQAFLVTFRKR